MNLERFGLRWRGEHHTRLLQRQLESGLSAGAGNTTYAELAEEEDGLISLARGTQFHQPAVLLARGNTWQSDVADFYDGLSAGAWHHTGSMSLTPHSLFIRWRGEHVEIHGKNQNSGLFAGAGNTNQHLNTLIHDLALSAGAGNNFWWNLN